MVDAARARALAQVALRSPPSADEPHARLGAMIGAYDAIRSHADPAQLAAMHPGLAPAERAIHRGHILVAARHLEIGLRAVLDLPVPVEASSLLDAGVRGAR